MCECLFECIINGRDRATVLMDEGLFKGLARSTLIHQESICSKKNLAAKCVSCLFVSTGLVSY